MLRVEPLEQRTLLATFAMQAVADGLVADRNLSGDFETVQTTGTSITNRWFRDFSIGQERGVMEFDLGNLTAGTQLASAKLGVHVMSFTATPAPNEDFPLVPLRVLPGDGAITAADGNAAAPTAGAATVNVLGYQEWTLDAELIESLLGGKAAVRFENSEEFGNWIQIASLEDGFGRQKPVLILETQDLPATLTLDIQAAAITEDGAGSSTIGVLTRTGDVSQSLAVQLTSSDTTEATVPASVTFAAGETQATFSIAAVDDNVVDGDRNVTITAQANIPEPVSLDASFGVSGLASTSLRMTIQPPRAALAIQPDGKILAAAETGSQQSWRITRLHPNGTVDTSFGNGGTVDTTFTNGTFPVPHKIIVQPDGKIVVGGKFAGGVGTSALVRYNANGSLDNTFGRNTNPSDSSSPRTGIADLANAGGWIGDMALRADGRLVVAVTTSGTVFFRVMGITTDGRFDPALVPRSYSNINASAQAIALHADGSFVLAGRDRVARMLPNGNLDPNFANGGIQIINFGVQFPTIHKVEVDSQGRYVLAVQVTNQATGSDFVAARLLPNGSLDLSFSGDGIASADFSGGSDVASSMILQPDDKIIMAGLTSSTAASVNDAALLRFNADGELDASFDTDGRFSQTLIPHDAERIFSIARQSDGKLLALAGWGLDYRVARFHTNENPTIAASDDVTVLDTDNSPPAAADLSVTLAENSATGAAVGTVVASDVDAGQTLSYAITGGNTAGAFAIDSATGAITVANRAALNFETTPTFTLTVTVTDNGTPALSATADVTVQLTDVNEAPAAADLSVTLAENSATGAAVGTVVANDVDAGQTLAYAITGGNTAGAFAIDSATGAITVANSAALDFETTPTFTLTVTVTDNGTPALSATAFVNVQLTPASGPLGVSIDFDVNHENAINANRGKVQMAILGTASLDVGSIDLNSLRFGATGQENSLEIHKGEVKHRLEDVNGDGRMDLIVFVDLELANLPVGNSTALLSGSLLDGLSIAGSDEVRIKKPGKGK